VELVPGRGNKTLGRGCVSWTWSKHRAGAGKQQAAGQGGVGGRPKQRWGRAGQKLSGPRHVAAGAEQGWESDKEKNGRFESFFT
jgi:hypothetical protein